VFRGYSRRAESGEHVGRKPNDVYGWDAGEENSGPLAPGIPGKREEASQSVVLVEVDDPSTRRYEAQKLAAALDENQIDRIADRKQFPVRSRFARSSPPPTRSYMKNATCFFLSIRGLLTADTRTGAAPTDWRARDPPGECAENT
jgi:hypothetical protein